MTNYEIKCLSCNEILGKSDNAYTQPPSECPKCKGTKIATQEEFITEIQNMDFDVVIFNKKTGVSKISGFIINADDIKNVEGNDLIKLFAERIAGSVSQILTLEIIGKLLKDEVKQ